MARFQPGQKVKLVKEISLADGGVIPVGSIGSIVSEGRWQGRPASTVKWILEEDFVCTWFDDQLEPANFIEILIALSR